MANHDAVDEVSSAGGSARSKFSPDGTPRHFPGNTIICPVSPDSAEAGHVAQAVEHLRRSFAFDFVLLPPTSWHMTVFELLCDQVRAVDRWSRYLDTATPLAVTDEFFAARIPTVSAPEELMMRYRSFTIGDDAAGLLLEPDDASTAAELEQYRERLSDVTGVRFPGHDTYRFHITVAYKLKEPSVETQRQIDAAAAQTHTDLDGARFRLPRPVLTYFSDMTEFVADARPGASS